MATMFPTDTSSPSPTARSAPGISPFVSPRGPITSQPCLALSSALPPVWSQWWWVLRMWVSFHPFSFRAASMGATSGVSTTAVAPVEGSCSRKE